MSELARQSIFRDPPRARVPLCGPHDDAILTILAAPLRAGETAHAGFRRKEYELGTLFGQLPVDDTRTLHARLGNPRDGDLVAQRFHLLTAERRARLVAFLADAPRRAALRAR